MPNEGAVPHFFAYTPPDTNTLNLYLALPTGVDGDTVFTVCAVLEEPYTVQIDSATMSLRIGTNTIWTDADSVEIAYPVDTKKYVDAGARDVRIDGTSILDGGVANIPIAGANVPGVVKVGRWYYGISLMSDGTLYVSTADSTVIKQGSVGYRGVAPEHQHEAVFYGLSKLAGVDLANKTVTLGQYPEPALVAIQKMLGVYESPWELIRIDTFTNATEADHEITVDQYGDALELTDAILVFTTPTQDNISGKGDYGRIRFWYGNGSSSFKDAYFNQYTQAANAEQRTGISKITQNGGLLEIVSRSNTGRTNVATTVLMGGQILDTSAMSTPVQLVSPPLIFSKITITAVTGTAKYWLYGKRKWT